MAEKLAIAENSRLTEEERAALDTELDRLMDGVKADEKKLDRLVFACAAVPAETGSAQNGGARMADAAAELDPAMREMLQDRADAVQYVSQQMLQKLADNDLLRFDLLTAVQNKLRASMTLAGETERGKELEAFLKKTRNQLVKRELQAAKGGKNGKLLIWQNSIEYFDCGGTAYTDMEPAGKLVCLVRDFFDVTEGIWSTSDLLLLKAALSAAGLAPGEKVNYGKILEDIAESAPLRDKWTGRLSLSAAMEPECLLAMSGIRKLMALHGEDRYIVEAVYAYAAKDRPDITKDDICHTLMRSYLRTQAEADVDMELDSFDMALELLYNLKRSVAEASAGVQEVSEEAGKPEKKDAEIPEKAPELIQAEELFRACRYREAYSLFRKLAAEHNGRAMYYMGEYLSHPYPREGKKNSENENMGLLQFFQMPVIPARDEQAAVDWWKQGADNGEALAALRAPDSNKETAFQKALTLAEQGDPAAQFEVGRCFDRGLGVAQDPKKAAEWYGRAAIQGETRAQNNLGNCYLNGTGVEEDQEMAVMWYRKAARQGCPQAQCNLADCHENLWGMDDSDEDEELEWYLKSARQGYAEAQYQLGEIYYYGNCGVDEDEDEAKDWFKLAAAQGHKKAQEALERFDDDDDDDDEDDDEDDDSWL